MGVTSARLTQMEVNGCRNVDNVRKWADVLEMDVATLLFGDAEKRGSKLSKKRSR